MMNCQATGLQSRRYQAEELLQMRASLPVLYCIANKLNPHPDIAVIIRLPEGVLQSLQSLSCEPDILLEITNHGQSQQLNDQANAKTSKRCENNTASSFHKSREYAHTQWNFRRRESSDRSSQPHSAPSGLLAQQPENFRRFYRAVVSPTHVRVTAGGRIVPNNRSKAPPLFDWNNEKRYFEPKHTSLENHGPLQPVSWPHSQQSQIGFSPILSSGFLPQGRTLTTEEMTSQASAGAFESEQFSFDNLQAQQEDKETSTACQSPPKPQQIKISPPNQFDQTRPFIYNGHLVYPIPHGFQPLSNAQYAPVSMLGNTHLLPRPKTSSNSFLQPPFQIPMPMVNPLMLNIGQQAPTNVQNECNALNLSPGTSQLSMPGLMPASKITKCQIQGLQNHLKYIDNQLANNRHQIDEAFMQNQRQALLMQINTAEPIFESHRKQELKFNTRIEESKVVESIGAKSDIPQRERKKTVVTIRAPQETQEIKEPVSSDQSGLSVSIKAGDIVSKAKAGEAMSTVKSDALVSRLSANAAKAPPFQPRLQSFNGQSSKETNHTKSLKGVVSSLSDPIGFSSSQGSQKSVAGCTRSIIGDSSHTAHDNNSATNARHSWSFAAISSSNDTSFQSIDDARAPDFRMASIFDEKLAAAMAVNSQPLMSSGPVPYLVGVLPQGVLASEARSTDLLYPRPLTEEEVRARYLYWGKAPRHVQSGLPKFDGKDFYPPSPIKDDIRLTSFDRPRSRQGALLDFERLFSEPEAVGPKKAERGQIKPSLLNTSLMNHEPLAQESSGCESPQKNTLVRHSSSETACDPTSAPKSIIVTDVDNVDFSDLFADSELPGFQANNTNSNYGEDDELSVTPKKAEPTDKLKFEDICTKPLKQQNSVSDATQDIYQPQTAPNGEVLGNGSESATSNIDMPSSPRNVESSTRCTKIPSFDEQIANCSTKQQTLFLQNMLKNTVTMAGPASSGSVISATAKGYLPQYRGSAAASLSPAILMPPFAERGAGCLATNFDSSQIIGRALTQTAANSLSESQPFKGNPASRSIRSAPETIDAESYMRYISQKKDAAKEDIEHGWNVKTTGTGPVMGSDW